MARGPLTNYVSLLTEFLYRHNKNQKPTLQGRLWGKVGEGGDNAQSRPHTPTLSLLLGYKEIPPVYFEGRYTLIEQSVTFIEQLFI